MSNNVRKWAFLRKYSFRKNVSSAIFRARIENQSVFRIIYQKKKNIVAYFFDFLGKYKSFVNGPIVIKSHHSLHKLFKLNFNLKLNSSFYSTIEHCTPNNKHRRGSEYQSWIPKSVHCTGNRCPISNQIELKESRPNELNKSFVVQRFKS